MINDPMHDNTQSNTERKTQMTSSSSQLFASLAGHDIFYRWQRIHNTNGDNMTNHNRKTLSVDKKAPAKMNDDSDKKSIFVNHLIILRPHSKKCCDKGQETDGKTMKGRTRVSLKSVTKTIGFFIWVDKIPSIKQYGNS